MILLMQHAVKILQMSQHGFRINLTACLVFATCCCNFVTVCHRVYQHNEYGAQLLHALTLHAVHLPHVHPFEHAVSI
jgi:hypothetical protein